MRACRCDLHGDAWPSEQIDRSSAMGHGRDIWKRRYLESDALAGGSENRCDLVPVRTVLGSFVAALPRKTSLYSRLDGLVLCHLVMSPRSTCCYRGASKLECARLRFFMWGILPRNMMHLPW